MFFKLRTWLKCIGVGRQVALLSMLDQTRLTSEHNRKIISRIYLLDQLPWTASLSVELITSVSTAITTENWTSQHKLPIFSFSQPKLHQWPPYSAASRIYTFIGLPFHGHKFGVSSSSLQSILTHLSPKSFNRLNIIQNILDECN